MKLFNNLKKAWAAFSGKDSHGSIGVGGDDPVFAAYKKQVEDQKAEIKMREDAIKKREREIALNNKLIQDQLQNVQKLERLSVNYEASMKAYAQSRLSIEAAKQLYEEETRGLWAGIHEKEALTPEELIEQYYPDKDGTVGILKQRLRAQLHTQSASHEQHAPSVPQPQPAPQTEIEEEEDEEIPFIPPDEATAASTERVKVVSSPFTSRSAKEILNRNGGM